MQQQNNNTVVTPDPPVKAAEVAKYFKDLYHRGGHDITDDDALQFAKSKDIGFHIRNTHRRFRLEMPDTKQIDSIISSFYEAPEVEKKNQVGNELDVLESAYVLDKPKSSSDSTIPQTQKELNVPYEIDPDQDPFDAVQIFNDALSKVDLNVFTSDPSESIDRLSSYFEPYEIKFSEVKDGIVKIDLPGGQSRSFNFFTDEYKKMLSAASSSEAIEQLSVKRLKEMKGFLLQAKDWAVDNYMFKLRRSEKENIIPLLGRILKSYDTDLAPEVIRLLRDFSPNEDYRGFYRDGFIDKKMLREYMDKVQYKITEGDIPESIKQGILKRSKQSPVSLLDALSEESVKQTAKESISVARDEFASSMEATSALVGNLLSRTGAYRNIDVFDESMLEQLERMGVFSGDIPLEAIKVNGQARSLNYLINNILYNFDKVQDIRDGKISIEIGDSKDAGLLAPFVENVKEIVKRQEAEVSYFAGNKALRIAQEGFELAENFVQGGLLSLYETGVSAAYLLYDSLRAAGIDDETADGIVYGNTGFWGVAGSGYRPENFKRMSEKYLPQWDGDYTDMFLGKASPLSFIARSSQDFSSNIVTTGLFFIPGAQPYALTNLGITSFSKDRIAFESLRSDILERKKKGYILTPEEINVLNTSDAYARNISLTKSISEVAITRAFSGKVFKEYHKLMKVRPKIEELHGSIGAFNRQYAKATRDGIISKYSKYLGVNTKLVAAEIPEEEIISTFDYVADVVAGYREYDREEYKKLLANTGIATLTQSYAIGVGMNVHVNPQIRAKGASLIKSRMTLAQEVGLVSTKLRVDAEIASLESQEKVEGKTQERTERLSYLKDLRETVNDGLLSIDFEKDQIVEKMSSADRVKFLDLYRQLNNLEKARVNAIDKGQRADADRQILEKRVEARGILSKYPSKLSFYFADNNVQQEYSTKALETLQEEYKARGEEFTLDSTDPIVQKKAAEIYFDEKKENELETLDVYDGFVGYGISNLPDIQGPLTLEQSKVTDNINTIKNIINGWNTTFNLQDVVEGTVTTEATAQRPTYIGKEVDSPTEDGIRLENIVLRLEGLDLGKSFTDFTQEELGIIEKFARDLRSEDQRRPNIGRMEALLDAHDRINSIYSASGGSIDLTGFETKDGSLTEVGAAKLFQLINNVSAGWMFGDVDSRKREGGFATLDVLQNILFRDEKAGKPFLDTYRELLRLRAEAKNTSETAFELLLENYKKEGGEESIDNDYELSILGNLKRESSTVNPSGKNQEFERNQKLLIDELARRKALSDKHPENAELKDEYEVLARTMDKLGVATATSFTDIEQRAETYNVNLIYAVANLMPSKAAFDRINDFEDYTPFEYTEGTYIPMFMTKEGESFSDIGGHSKTLLTKEAKAGSLMDVTRPEALQGGLRLNMNLYLRNLQKAYTGLNIDIATKKERETLDFMVNSPKFQDIFRGNKRIKEALLTAFKEIKPRFDMDIRVGGADFMSLETINSWKGKKWFNDLANSATGIVSNVALSRVFQPASQYYSAVAGGSQYISNSEAKQYLTFKGLEYTSGFGYVLDKNKQTADFDNIGAKIFKYRDAVLGNLYSKSRTGSRNALMSNIMLDPKKELPASYYTRTFGLSKDAEGQVFNMFPGKGDAVMTIDRFFEAISRNTEASLNFWLANADKIASNAVFEAAYMDFMIDKGEKIGDRNAWWKKQNENPNLEAIRHADNIIAKTMRQTDPISEAQLFRSDAKGYVKNGMRSLYAYNKFIINAKTDIAKNASILLDPNISPEQAEQAKKAIRGRALEIMSYDGIKYGGAIYMTKGAVGFFLSTIAPFLGVSVEERDIEDYEGGYGDELIGKLLPILSSDENFDPEKVDLLDATSLEDYEAIKKYRKGFQEIASIGSELQGMKFEDKFTVQGDYDVLGRVLQSLGTSMQPIPTPSLVDGYLARGFNLLYGEDILEEYVSYDDDKLRTMGGRLDYLSQNAGIPSLVLEQMRSFERALEMSKDFVIEKDGGEKRGVIVEHLTAPTDNMRRSLIAATNVLLTVRIASLFSAGSKLPSADLDRFADRLERAIDTYFTQGKKDEQMHLLKESSSMYPLIDDELEMNRGFLQNQ